ncbi:hypothetical protein OS493_027890 [Desmophyllum pertusum]|uniref:Uncharacterized protein n=1 Tax=Desmophyllum pertusum TaxID=174260 RepID=A0A9W9YKL8_9CNID|nr:hypothetical protein OS493_027890 [Desmophyllum pertusum]
MGCLHESYWFVQWGAITTTLNSTQKNVKTTSKIKAKEISSAEDHITLYQEALLCVISCLHILKAISSHCDFKQLWHCLRSIEVSIPVLSKTAVPEKEDKSEKMKQMVVECCEVVEKCLERKAFYPVRFQGTI